MMLNHSRAAAARELGMRTGSGSPASAHAGRKEGAR